jgi:dTDP-4-amino-4,6-dideoxygalactose transaminase
MGPETDRFEQQFASCLGTRHAFATANGTAALHLLLAASGIGPGDEVVVPSMTFVATANAVAYTGAKPVFCDVESASRPWITAELVAPLIGARTKAILTMPYGGHPGDTAELEQLARSRGLLLLIDAAHALGARIGVRGVGAFGAGAAFSFFSNKNLAIGEGGIVVTDDDEIADRIRLLRSHGMTTLTWDRHRGHASEYDVVALGFNYRIDEPRATLGRIRLGQIDALTAQRAAAVDYYREALSGIEAVLPVAPPEPDTVSAHHLFTIVLDRSIDRDRFRAALREAGIQTSLHYPPVHHFSIYADGHWDLPETDAYAAHTVTLPLFAHVSEEQLEAVVAALRSAVRVPIASL